MSETIESNVEIEETPEPQKKEQKVYTVGTLRYTMKGLVMVFIWILWGDFIFTLMESVFPVVMQLTLDRLNSPNVLMGVLMVTIPSAINFFVTPWVSFKSDRHRSKWGRRIPFLLIPTLFVALFLVLLAYAEDIGPFLHRSVLAHAGYSEAYVTLGVVAVLMVAFRFFDMFANSVYWYLFNDVIPHEFLARFMSLFRIVGTFAGMLFSFFLMKYTGSHGKVMLIGAGLVYLFGYSLMCLKVKEGEYPPPPENVDGKKSSFSSMKTFFVECFSHKYYWYNFLASTFWGMGTAIGFVTILYWRSLGITLQQMGYMGGIASAIGLLLIYPAGMYSDRKHPLRTILIGLAGFIIINPISMIFIFHDFHADVAYKIMFVLRMINLPILSLYGVAATTLTMRIYPQDKYGQYCSAEAMVRAGGVIVGGVLAGVFLDMTKAATGGGDFYYRYTPLWNQLFYMLSFVFMFIVYRYWKHYGGDESYRPPVVGCVAQREEATESVAMP